MLLEFELELLLELLLLFELELLLLFELLFELELLLLLLFEFEFELLLEFELELLLEFELEFEPELLLEFELPLRSSPTSRTRVPPASGGAERSLPAPMNRLRKLTGSSAAAGIAMALVDRKVAAMNFLRRILGPSSDFRRTAAVQHATCQEGRWGDRGAIANTAADFRRPAVPASASGACAGARCLLTPRGTSA